MQTNSITLPRHREDRSPAWNTLNVLIAAKQACRIFGLGPSTFGRRAAGDPRLISDMENGRVLQPETEVKVRAFIAAMAGRPATDSCGRAAKPIDVARFTPRGRGRPAGIIGAAGQVSHREAMTRGSTMLLQAINDVRKGA